MANINRTQGSGNQNFKQIEGDSWLSIYLPVICAGTVIAVVLLVAIACSKKSDQPVARISAPTMPATTSATSGTSAAPQLVAKKVVKKARPANATYVNATYGVSFSYPRKYSLQSGDKKSSMPVPASFLKPGAIQVATVDMPDDQYPDTDFSSALLNVSVNPGLTAEECGQFVPNAKDSEAAKPASAKLGANQFAELEQMNGEDNSQSDLKYFHLFKNGACYEFALDVVTSRKPDVDLAQADRGKIFQQLEKILATARIKDVELPGVEKAQTTDNTVMAVTHTSASAGDQAKEVSPAPKSDQK
jgi:hypothetical protein